MKNDRMLTSGQLAMRRGYPSEETLSRWRHDNIGPAYVRIGGRVFYDLTDIEAWEKSRRGGGEEMPARKKRGRKPKVKPAARRHTARQKVTGMGDLFDGT
ncbi:MAG: helix-turn-helix transcriptional regulator [Acidobacteriota bacterium]